VVEEEFEHARASFPCRCSSKTFRATPTGQRLAKSLSHYVDGNFRGEFSGASELRDQVGRSLRAMVDTRNNRPMDHDPIAPHLLKPYRFSDQTGLRFAIAPERVEEVFDPLDQASPGCAERMLEIGHSRDVRLFG
jgi:hypothetical protein